MDLENGTRSKDVDGYIQELKTKPDKRQTGGYGGVVDRSTWMRLQPSSKHFQWAQLSFNPVVTFISLAIVLAFALWAMLLPEVANTEFGNWKTWVGFNFTWLYIGSQDVWAVFIIIVYLSKYGNIKLGPDGSKPEYNDASWFSMLFACGVSTGLFFYGVAEPLYHYIGPNRYTADPTMPDNKLAQEAINITLYHWGLHGWVVYTIVGLILALMAHREGLPLTMKSCFYPLIGDKIFGWPGDLVDILSVIATLFGVCTSLGLGTMQINEGLHLMNSDIPVSTRSQLIIIWSITMVATGSVLTGVKYGIRRISEFCFCFGLALMLCVLFLDNTVYLLNLYVQSMGYYFQWLLQLGFHSDAFEQLGPSAGAEDRGRFIPEGFVTTDGPSGWMNNWTIFYWGWWIAWCPFVGMFIAKISVGRTIKEFIAGTMAAPVIYVFMWMIIFGGAGLRMEREAAQNDLCCHNIDMGRVFNLSVTGQSALISLDDGLCDAKECNSCASKLLTKTINASMTYEDLKNEAELFNKPEWWGKTTVSRKLTRLSCRKTEEMWFDMMMSYGDLGNFLCGFSLISLILYFVTSSDSGSLVIDCLASNGHPEPPKLQRLLWALIEGLTATALLVAGGKQALTALQAMSIATGLIYTILMCIACVALWRAMQVEAGDLDPHGPSFDVDILDPFFTDPFDQVVSKFSSTFKLFLKFLLNLIITPLTVAKTSSRVIDVSTFWPVLISLSIFLVMFVLLHILQLAVDGAWALAWISYIAFGSGISIVRSKTRKHLNIAGHPLEDLCLSLLLYPCVALQMEVSTAPGRIQKGQTDKYEDKVKDNQAFSYSMDSVPAVVISSKES